MTFIRLWRTMPSLVHEQTDMLRAEMAELFERQGLPVSDETRRECLLFILWSIHVGLANMHPKFLGSLLSWVHRRKIRAHERADHPRLMAQFERRQIEALYGVWNILAARNGQDWEITMSPRSARLFLEKASAGMPVAMPVTVLDTVLGILRRRNSACLGVVLAA